MALGSKRKHFCSSKASESTFGIESLNLIARINALQDENFVTMYPNLFKGLGTIAEEYFISLREGTKPFAISTPRRIQLCTSYANSKTGA